MADPELEKRRMEFEERKWVEEMRLETEKLAAQREYLTLETERVKLERQRLRLQVQTSESPAALAKRYGDALRGVLSRMPTDAADLPAFSENAERVFNDIGAPNMYITQLLMPF